MFAALPIERELFGFKDLLPGLAYWIESVGGYALVGLILWCIIGLTLMKPKELARIPAGFKLLFVSATVASFLLYSAYAFCMWRFPLPPVDVTGEGVILTQRAFTWRDWLGACAGACALVAVCAPIVRNLLALNFRRIGALARLSFKEAIRRRVLYVFSILLLVFLFASWFTPPDKPEDQLRNYILIVESVMAPLLLFTAAFLASFSIPNDIKQQTIHTILTKPVERFEVILGRFLGYSALMTLVLIVMTGVSLIYLVRQIDPDAAAESLKAREPLWGELSFEGTGREHSGVNVGKEWDYRSYISAPTPGQPRHSAIWQFPVIPPSFATRKSVPCEFAFDVFRGTKGYEDRGISSGLYFRTWRCKKGNVELYQKELQERRGRKDRTADLDLLNELSEKYGYFEVPAIAVSSGHTYEVDLPGGLFKSIAEGPDDTLRREAEATKKPLPPLEVRVQCHSSTQYLGMAKYDLWLRQDDPNGHYDKLWFACNFFKAQAVNLWLKLILVIGVSVALSTYLSGVITLLVVGVLYVGGIILNFIQSVAFGTNFGGGPFQAAYTLFNRKLPAAGIEETPTTSVLLFTDEGVRFGMRRVLDLFPDVERFDFTRFVQEGFNIPESQILINLLLMTAYVLPWIVLAYYLLKWREVASAS